MVTTTRPTATPNRVSASLTHLIAKIEWVEAKQESEPALRKRGDAIVAHCASVANSPPTRAARMSVSSRLASARAARHPAFVMR